MWPAHALADRRHRALDDVLHALLRPARVGTARVTLHAVARVRPASTRDLDAHLRRVDGQHQRGVGQARMLADLRRAETLGAQGLVQPGRRGLVVGRQRVDLRHARGHALEAAPVAAVVAEQHHMRQPGTLQAARAGFEHGLEGGRRHADRAGVAHVFGRRIDRTFGHVGHHRRDQRIAELPRDALGEQAHAHVVLAQRHVRTVLLGAADRYQRDRAAGRDAVAQLGPGQLLKMDRRRLRGTGRQRRDRQREGDPGRAAHAIRRRRRGCRRAGRHRPRRRAPSPPRARRRAAARPRRRARPGARTAGSAATPCRGR